jgi:hypothetical protein
MNSKACKSAYIRKPYVTLYMAGNFFSILLYFAETILISCMKKPVIVVLLICTVCTLKAQNKCDSLYGKWIFTRWQTDHSLLDTEDSVATIQYKLQQYKDANNGASMLAADSLALVNGLKEMFESIRKNGFISFTLNKNKTFSWKGTVNDPNEQFSGTYSCNGETMTLSSKKNKTDKETNQIILQLISFNKNRLTVLLPSYNNPDLKENRMSFKRVP